MLVELFNFFVMKTSVFVYYPGLDRSERTDEIIDAVCQTLEPYASEAQALSDPRTLVVQFTNSIKIDETAWLVRSRRRLFENHRLLFVGPALRAEAKYQLLQTGVNNYLAYDEPLRLCQQIEEIAAAENLQPIWQLGDLTLDPVTRMVKRRDKLIRLRNQEFALLRYLIVRPHRPFSVADLLENVWGYSFQVVSNTVQAHISSLRRKIDDGFENKLIHTIPSLGYVMSDRAKQLGIS